MKKRITIALAVVCCLSLLVGSFAFFTDMADIDGTATVGTLAVGLEATDISEQLLQANGAEGAKIDNWNPGDNVPFTYTVENDGNKAIRAQETITLTVTAAEGRTITATALADAKLTIRDNAGNVLTTVNTVAPEAVEGGYKLVYIMPEFTLSGSQEVITGSTDTTKAVTYSLDFDSSALNNYQAAGIAIAVHVDAIQALNTTESVAANTVHEYATIEQELIITDADGLTA